MPTKTTVVDIVSGNTLRSPPENQHAICHKKRAFREHQFWESMMTWSPLLYKIQILQRQADHNKAERESFCEDINQRSENDPGLFDLIFFSDKSQFHLSGHINKQNMRFWAQAKPHELTHCPLSQEKMTVWYAIGPYFFEDWESCDAGHRPLNCTYADEVHSWRKKGAPPHCWDRSLELLDPYFPGDRLISRRTDFPWQRYSSDLNPCDYFLLRYLKEWIYDNNPQTPADLKDNIRRKIRHIPADMVGQVIDNFNVRVAAVILQGAWIEHIINYSGHTMHTT